MVTFAVLALRPGETKQVEVDEYTVTYSSTAVPSAPPLMHVEV